MINNKKTTNRINIKINKICTRAILLPARPWEVHKYLSPTKWLEKAKTMP
jgi:hypothetical protein